jgi:hypothetical protein
MTETYGTLYDLMASSTILQQESDHSDRGLNR